MAEPASKTTASKATPKRKAPAKRKPAAKRKAPAKRKPAAKKVETKVETTFAKFEKLTSEATSKAKETGRGAFLASLGCYGMAYDKMQAQVDSAQAKFDSRKKEADKVYKKLVKRGEKLEKDAIKAMDGVNFASFDLDDFTDRKKLEASLTQAKAKFEEFKSTASAKFAF